MATFSTSLRNHTALLTQSHDCSCYVTFTSTALLTK